VIGLGQFGAEVARELAKHCEVLALDRSAEVVNEISEQVQRALCLDARDFASLSSVVTADFDEAVIGMSGSMEASILCALHLKKIGVKRIRAKALNEDHAEILKAIGISELIFPERETAHRIAARVVNPHLLEMIPLAEDYEVMDLAPPDSFHGRSLLDLNLRKRFGVFVMAVKELVPHNFVFMPGPMFVVKPSDILVVIGRENDLVAMREADVSKPPPEES
jgi:trk system potassium uptake protein TrkA